MQTHQEDKEPENEMQPLDVASIVQRATENPSNYLGAITENVVGSYYRWRRVDGSVVLTDIPDEINFDDFDPTTHRGEHYYEMSASGEWHFVWTEYGEREEVSVLEMFDTFVVPSSGGRPLINSSIRRREAAETFGGEQFSFAAFVLERVIEESVNCPLEPSFDRDDTESARRDKRFAEVLDVVGYQWETWDELRKNWFCKDPIDFLREGYGMWCWDDASVAARAIGAGASNERIPVPVLGQRQSSIRDSNGSLFSLSDLEGRVPSEMRWLVDGMIPEGHVSMLSGEGGVGKTLLAQQLGMCATVGKPFFGIPTQGCKILAVFTEDDDSIIHIRSYDIAAHEKIELKDLSDFKAWTRVACESNFSNEEGKLQSFRLAVQRELFRLRAGSSKPILLILDTAARVFGGNEIIRNEVTRFVSTTLGTIAQEFGAVLLLAHPSKSGIASGAGDSGSTAWNGSVRARSYLKKTDGDCRELVFMKSNYGAPLDPMTLRIEGGAFTLVRQGQTSGPEVVRALMAAMRAHDAVRRQDGWLMLSPEPRAKNNVWTVLSGLSETVGFDSKALKVAYQRALHDGLCKIVSTGNKRGQAEEVVPV